MLATRYASSGRLASQAPRGRMLPPTKGAVDIPEKQVETLVADLLGSLTSLEPPPAVKRYKRRF